jgi:N-acetylmuramoyl-L-alanine amidase
MAVVVIDAGHGGASKVGGSSANNATSPSGLLEKQLTLAVARQA